MNDNFQKVFIEIRGATGGDEAKIWAKDLARMYLRFAIRRGWKTSSIDELTIAISGFNVFELLKNESGVHRLVRISPFSATKKRHTSFSMVEIIPKFERPEEIKIPEQDLRVELSRASGPGGQNVNKRETAVRVVHIPTNLAVHVESERSQAQNKEKALRMLEAKLYKMMEEERRAKEKGMYISKTTQIEWGNQIRSYVFHPYQLVKDHRTNVETAQVEKVLNGDLDEFLEAEKSL